MKRKLFSCEVMKDEVLWLLDSLGRKDIEPDWLEMGLHQEPSKLNAELRKRIAACEGGGFDAILLMFGLCSNAVIGLTPPSDSRLVIPRVHDCISVYLGSGRRYQAEHNAEPGTYWFSRGFLHRTDGVGWEDGGLGTDFGGLDENGQRMNREELRQSYIEQYGEDNAEYLMEVLVDSWKANYRRAVYLEWADFAGKAEDRQTVKSHADENGWEFTSMDVNLRLLKGLLQGEWPSEEFLVVEPGQVLLASNDAAIFKTASA